MADGKRCKRKLKASGREPAEKNTKAERQALQNFLAWKNLRPEAPRLKIDKGNPAGNTASSALSLLSAFGTVSADFCVRTLGDLLKVVCEGDNESDANAALAAMHSIAPQDEIEAMLAAQMVATHFVAMKHLRQVQKAEHLHHLESFGNAAVKLTRTFTIQLDALQRYRGKGQQKMTVEHVHIHAGGQAIVGNVTRQERGGVAKKTEEQPHAKQIGHAYQPKVPGADAQEQPLPIARNAKR